MREIGLVELKQLQLDILEAAHVCCIKNKINYWLDCGTLLGAIRHNGYIPWDDDIDIGMLRNDYEQFRKIFNQENDRYKFTCVENDSEYCFAFGKILDTNTVLYEPDKRGRKISVYIDVFVYDNAPDDDAALKRMYQIRNFYRGCNTARTQMPDDVPGKFRKAVFFLAHYALKVFPKNYFSRKMVVNSQKLKDKDTRRVGNFTSRYEFACDKHVFDVFVDHEFEGKAYKIPIGYDEWLKSIYGDYMKMPPIEERIHSHNFEAYMKE